MVAEIVSKDPSMGYRRVFSILNERHGMDIGDVRKGFTRPATLTPGEREKQKQLENSIRHLVRELKESYGCEKRYCRIDNGGKTTQIP